MTSVDTNILVYAKMAESPFNPRAKEVMASLAQGDAPWAIPYQCLVEFYGKITHPRIFASPATPQEALLQIEAWTASPSCEVHTETSTTWSIFQQLLEGAKIVGSQVHDARIAAVCLSHGVSELLSVDRDFSRFPRLKVRNPLV